MTGLGDAGVSDGDAETSSTAEVTGGGGGVDHTTATGTGTLDGADRPYVIGHRGCLVGQPENTVRAALAAAPYVDAIEIDVRRCGSGELVVVHDPTLERICDADVMVDARSVTELQAYGVAGTDEPVPTLSQLVEAVPSSVALNVEVKTTGMAEDVAEILESAPNDAFISSFSARALAEFREVAPALTRGLLYKRSWERARRAADRLGCDLLHPYAEIVDRESIRSAAAAGFRVNAWGIADRETYAGVVDLGVNGVIIDDYRFARDESRE